MQELPDQKRYPEQNSALGIAEPQRPNSGPSPDQRLRALEAALSPFYGDKIRDALAVIVATDTAKSAA